MTREEEIRKSAFEYIKSDAVKAGEEYTSFGDFINGAKWADEHPKQIEISLEDIEELAKEVIPDDWVKRQDTLWEMIRRNQRAQFIDKACEWLRAELDKEEELHYIHVHGFDKENREIFLEDFCKAMKGD